MAQVPFLADINLSSNQLLNAKMQNLGIHPFTAADASKKGFFYYNTTDSAAYIWDGANWDLMSDTGSFNGDITADQITETARLFVSAAEKDTWNGKQAALGYTPENIANKQNSLAVDGAGVKYPTVDAVNTLKWIKSNESLTLAQRKGDVLYGILDQYTGEGVTLSKVTGTPTVDGVIYFQLGSEYFKRNFESYPRLSWFGNIASFLSSNASNSFIGVVIDVLVKDFSSITLPANLKLNFEKNGGFENGTLIGQNNKITNFNKDYIFKNILIHGNWDIEKAYSNWFFTYKNGYDIDKDSMVIVGGVKYYSVNGIQYIEKTNPSVSYNDDTLILQQLLNLKAIHTIIDEGIYMINPSTSEDMNGYYGGLTFRNRTGSILELNGILKAIQNSNANTSVLRIEFCEKVKLIGIGKIVGDVCEHPNDTGEGGMGLVVHSSNNIEVKDLVFENCFGDGIFVSWNQRWTGDLSAQELVRLNKQFNHYFDNIKVFNNRRTGLVYELGDYVEISNSEFSKTSTWRGTSTFSGIDIEPFGYADAPIRYCKSFNIYGCKFIGNGLGTGLRVERGLDFNIYGNYFESNNQDIELHQCVSGDYDLTSNTDRANIGGYANVYSNKSHNSSTFINASYTPSRAIVRDNYIQNINSFVRGMWVDSNFENNKIYNTNEVFYLDYAVNVTFKNNSFFHVRQEGQSWNNTAMMSLVRSGSGILAKNFYFIDNYFEDFSGKILKGSGDKGNTIMPNAVMRNFPLLYNSALCGENIVFKNNKFDKNILFVPSQFSVYGENGLTIENKIGDLSKAVTVMKGDIVYDNVNKQQATCVISGRVGIEANWVLFTPGLAVPPNTVLYNSDFSKQGVTLLGGTCGVDFPPYYTNQGAGVVTIDKPSVMPLPIFKWETTGYCTTATRPTTFNSVGRTLFDSDINSYIVFNGSGWNITSTLNSPALTGTPTAPTAPVGTNTTQIATTAFVSNANSGNVTLTGNQSIAGNKTLSGTTTLNETIIREGYKLKFPNGVMYQSSVGTNALTDNRTVSFPDASGTIALVETVKPYKVYTALLSQLGTGAPTATVLENTLGGSITWSRSSVGLFIGTLAGAFTASKTCFLATLGLVPTSGGSIISITRTSIDTILIRTTNSSGSVTDGILDNALIEIRVYN